MSYTSDIFISYRRRGDVEQWVQLHFRDRLQQTLTNLMGDEPRVWIDVEQEQGTPWPENIRSALLGSKLLIAIWSPDYFRSEWCMAEWKSMMARQDYVRKNGSQMPPALVYPVRYSDGDSFHPDAKLIQCRRDFSQLNYPFETFRDSLKYMDFHDAVHGIAEDLTRWLVDVPPWQADWPVETPKAMALFCLNVVTPS